MLPPAHCVSDLIAYVINAMKTSNSKIVFLFVFCVNSPWSWRTRPFHFLFWQILSICISRDLSGSVTERTVPEIPSFCVLIHIFSEPAFLGISESPFVTFVTFLQQVCVPEINGHAEHRRKSRGYGMRGHVRADKERLLCLTATCKTSICT